MDKQKVVDWIEDLRATFHSDIDAITQKSALNVHQASADKYKAEGAVNVLTYLLHELKAPTGVLYESKPEPVNEPVVLEDWLEDKSQEALQDYTSCRDWYGLDDGRTHQSYGNYRAFKDTLTKLRAGAFATVDVNMYRIHVFDCAHFDYFGIAQNEDERIYIVAADTEDAAANLAIAYHEASYPGRQVSTTYRLLLNKHNNSPVWH